jgi:hypothetical protein
VTHFRALMEQSVRARSVGRSRAYRAARDSYNGAVMSSIATHGMDLASTAAVAAAGWIGPSIWGYLRQWWRTSAMMRSTSIGFSA